EARSAAVEKALREAAAGAGVAEKVCMNRVGSMMCCFFTQPPVTDYASAMASDTNAHAAFFHAMLDAGVYLAPSQFEAMFVSAAHSDADIEQTAAAARAAFTAAAGLM
ncbi:MAG TPA: aspartate aminotransferase family protein, partial [Phycisphaerae bacterium]|nr:aspartate aminotransferase family protein [Phycisphaerae bacterium]